VQLDDEAARRHIPRLVFVDRRNRIVRLDSGEAASEKPFARFASKA
jgi:aspartate 1-decarboxylase